MREHFSRVKDGVLVAVQRRDAGRAQHEKVRREKLFRPLGAQLVQLDRSRSRTCTEPSAPALRAFFYFLLQKYLVLHGTKTCRLFRPLGAQLVQLDRSRSRTCTEPSAPALRAVFYFCSFQLFFKQCNQSVIISMRKTEA